MFVGKTLISLVMNLNNLERIHLILMKSRSLLFVVTMFINFFFAQL